MNLPEILIYLLMCDTYTLAHHEGRGITNGDPWRSPSAIEMAVLRLIKQKFRINWTLNPSVSSLRYQLEPVNLVLIK